MAYLEERYNPATGKNELFDNVNRVYRGPGWTTAMMNTLLDLGYKVSRVQKNSFTNQLIDQDEVSWFEVRLPNGETQQFSRGSFNAGSQEISQKFDTLVRQKANQASASTTTTAANVTPTTGNDISTAGTDTNTTDATTDNPQLIADYAIGMIETGGRQLTPTEKSRIIGLAQTSGMTPQVFANSIMEQFDIEQQGSLEQTKFQRERLLDAVRRNAMAERAMGYDPTGLDIAQFEQESYTQPVQTPRSEQQTSTPGATATLARPDAPRATQTPSVTVPTQGSGISQSFSGQGTQQQAAQQAQKLATNTLSGIDNSVQGQMDSQSQSFTDRMTNRMANNQMDLGSQMSALNQQAQSSIESNNDKIAQLHQKQMDLMNQPMSPAVQQQIRLLDVQINGLRNMNALAQPPHTSLKQPPPSINFRSGGTSQTGSGGTGSGGIGIKSPVIGG
jgi:hypothetical protein